MPHLTLRFFNSFTVARDGQPLTAFRSANNQGLLAYLALERERPAARESVAALLWPEENDKNARNNLRQAIYQLRQVLGDAGDDEAQPYLLVTRDTVQFNGDGDYSLDVDRFLAAIEARDLQAAANAYTGELLPGFTVDSLEFEDWLRRQREYLHRLALEALTELTQDHLQAGRLREAQEGARRQLALEPWREQAYRQLMQAYALGGDRTNALAAYETARERLWAELAVEPAPETTALYEDIKAGRYGTMDTGEALRPPVRPQHNLPADTTPFIGREVEIEQVRQLLSHGGHRLVSILGPGGMGKTRLALAAAAGLLDQYRDGVAFVNLAPLSRPAEIAPAIAAALDYQPPDRDEDILPQLLHALSRRQMLLLLDNFEHLLGGAPLVDDILRAAPEVTVLATSRQRLNLASESRYELGGLDVPESLSPAAALETTAVRIFVDNARRARADFALTDDNVGDVLRICRLVQGMPLGLVLAAAWLELLTPAEIAAEIEKSLSFLAADLADLPPRQRSMEAVFACSWWIMAPAEQTVLAKLSVFRGGFTREAAEEVAGANLRVLLALVNKSLLTRHAESGRFSVHELLRQYAGGQLDDRRDDVELAHCHYYAAVVEREVERALGWHATHLARQFAADRDNIRRAWDYAVAHGLVAEVAAMARGIVIFSYRQGVKPGGLLHEAITALERQGAAPEERAMLMLRLLQCSVRVELDDSSEARREYFALLDFIEENGDPELRYWALERVAYLELEQSDEERLAFQERAYQAALKTGDERFIKMAEALTLWIGSEFGIQYASARERLQALLAYFEPDYPNSFTVYCILWALAAYCSRDGDHEQALTYGTRALNRAKGWHDLFWIGQAAELVADTDIALGRRDEAVAQLVDALEWHTAIGQPWQTLGFLWSTAVHYPDFTGGPAAVVPIISMVYHHPDTVPYYRQNIERARPQFEQQLGPQAFAAAWEAGKTLAFEEAVARLRGALVGEIS